MQDFLTAAGLAVVNAGQYQRITSFKLGSQYNYTPNVSDTTIRGTQVYTGSITSVEVITSSQVLVTVVLPAVAGPFTYGEIGIFLDDNSLFSLSAWGFLNYKQVQTVDPDGVATRIDVYVDVSGGTAAINTGNSTNRLQAVTSYLNLPNPAEASNFYIFPDPDDATNSCLAYSTGLLWTFDAFSRETTLNMDSAVTANGFTVNSTTTGLTVGKLLQISNGSAKGIVRRVANIIVGGSSTAVTYDTPLMVTPAIADDVIVYKRTALPGNNVVSPALTQLDMSNYKIVNLGTPTAATDAANKTYVDSNFIGSANNHAPTADISWGNRKLTNLAAPTAGTDATNKAYVDSIAVAGGFAAGTTPATGNPDLATYRLVNVGTPVSSADGANKSYVDTAVGARLALAGGTMAGSVNMGGNLITNVANAVNPGDAINRTTGDTRYVQTSGSSTMTGSLNMGNQTIINLSAPVGGNDAATKDYVDTAVQIRSNKDSVVIASTGNINLSAPGGTLDGITPSVGARFLAKNQTTASENGIYIFNGAGVAATRATDFNTSAKAIPGSQVRVQQGTANAGTEWYLSTTGAITLGTTALAFSQVTAGASSGVILANGTVPFTGAADIGGNRIVNLAAPTGANDAVNRAYLDAVADPISVIAASTGNINLSAPGAAIDGVSLSAGNRFLAKDQTTGSQNGIYVWNGSAAVATRATDFNSLPSVHYGAVVMVQQGTMNGNSAWKLITQGTITVGSTILTFSNISASAGILPDGTVPMTGNLNLGNQRVINMGYPVASTDAASKLYVDDAILGKQNIQVRAATTVNINLNSPGSSIDGVTLSVGNLFLAKNQTTGSQNGVYVWNGAASSATRATSYSLSAHVTSATFIAVQEGSTQGDSVWMLTTNDPIVLGTSSLAYQRMDTPNAIRSDGTISMIAPLNMGSQRAIGLADPLSNTDAATALYSEFAGRGFLLRAPVSAASTVNVNIAAPGSSIDGVTLAATNRVLLKNQTTPAENGIWIWNGAGSPMTRATDFNNAATCLRGVLVKVSAGTQANQYWAHVTPAPTVTVGTTNLTFMMVDPTLYELQRVPRVWTDTNAGGSYTLDLGLYDEFQLTLTSNINLGVTNAIPGARAIVKLKQDSTGGRTVTMPGIIRYNAGVTSYTHTGTANSIDLVGFRYDFTDNKLDIVALIKTLA